MQRFSYKAHEASGRPATGRPATGMINAHSEHDARQKLLERYASVDHVREQPGIVASSDDGNLIFLRPDQTTPVRVVETDDESSKNAAPSEKMAKELAFLKRMSLQAARDEAARHRLKSEITSEMRQSQRKAANGTRPRRKGNRNSVRQRTQRTGQTPSPKNELPSPPAETPRQMAWKLALSFLRDFINRRPILRSLLTQLVTLASGLGAYLLAPQATAIPAHLPINSGVVLWIVVGFLLVILLTWFVRQFSMRRPKTVTRSPKRVTLPNRKALWFLCSACVVVLGVAAGVAVRHFSDQHTANSAKAGITGDSTSNQQPPIVEPAANPPVEKPNIQNDETSLQTNLDEWNSQQARLRELARDMQQEKSVIVRKLQAVGISSGNDLAGNAEGRLYADELMEIVQTIREIDQKTESLSFAIAQGESLLRKIDRQKRLQYAGITSEQREVFASVRLGIEERLRTNTRSDNAAEALQMNDVLDQELRTES